MWYNEQGASHRAPAAGDGMEGSLLPEGSGDAESPEGLQLALWDERVRQQQEERMLIFAGVYDEWVPRRRRRNVFNDYTTKNCEEAWGRGTNPAKDLVGRQVRSLRGRKRGAGSGGAHA